MNNNAVENFISSLDLNMSMAEHFRNCLHDAKLYRWESKTIVAIMKAIEDAYKK